MMGFVGVGGFCGSAAGQKARISGQGLASARRVSVARSCRSRVSMTLAEPMVETEAPVSASEESFVERDDIRNIAIVAHVDHGKTTLVDALLAEAKVFRENQTVQERVMDSNDLERERGITILAKNAAINYEDVKVNIVDTPGHADFGGEVERVLNMVDGVLLVVDAVEGPKPQTRFVLKKAIEMGHKIVVVVNKIDRPNSRPDYVLDSTFDLFVELGASDEQTDFEVVYCSALRKVSGPSPDELEDNLKAVLDCILTLPKPKVKVDGKLQMMVSNVDYDEFKGRLGIGRILSGEVRSKSEITVCHPEKDPKKQRISEVFAFNNLGKASVDSASAGDLVMFAGVEQFDIGDTIADTSAPTPLPPIAVEEPTVRMSFSVNTTEFAGREGKYVTSRNLRDRLMKELEKNVAMRVENTDSADTFIVCGRGPLHLTILIETMRREGFEFLVGPPDVIYKKIDGEQCEPFETVDIEVQEEYMGGVVDLLGRRKGLMTDMGSCNAEGMCSVTYVIPTRGLLGVRSAILTATRGTAIMTTTFAGYQPYAGDLPKKDQGSLLAYETGKVTTYGVEGAQDRGKLFVKPGEEIYKNQIVGLHQRPGNLNINVCKTKALTNFRASGKDNDKNVQGFIDLSLDDCIEYIGQGELVELTPESIRMLVKVTKKQK
ncbi:hypothetical protein NDN08_001296 [Rhodosorus marinus]|uniref:Tr-type G domain-containing protein n=1 Tax=Rhodosorus marinus TaxID=101924 RepID=A0AAV8UW68_9RHOD|nr:hypothetical protein NDN08_001296 [Rhodosorus marinus]